MSRYDGATAAVIGGSIGGLTAALLLRDLGFSVEIYERTPSALDGRGGGIVLQPDTVRWFTERSSQQPQSLHTSTDWVQYLDTDNRVIDRDQRTWTYTSWGTFYRALLADFGTADYHLGEFACGFDQDERGATVRFVSGRAVTADLVVFADGITSTARSASTRPRSSPTPDTSAGAGPSPSTSSPTAPASCSATPSPTASCRTPTSRSTRSPARPAPRSGTEPGDRLMNYVWYRNVPAGPEAVGDAHRQARHPRQGVVARPARCRTATSTRCARPPHRDAGAGRGRGRHRDRHARYVQVGVGRRSSPMADGRVALIGDAACAARPHAAAGTAKAAADALGARRRTRRGRRRRRRRAAEVGARAARAQRRTAGPGRRHGRALAVQQHLGPRRPQPALRPLRPRPMTTHPITLGEQ